MGPGGRPAKDAASKRSRTISIRVTPAVHEHLAARALEEGADSVAQVVLAFTMIGSDAVPRGMLRQRWGALLDRLR